MADQDRLFVAVAEVVKVESLPQTAAGKSGCVLTAPAMKGANPYILFVRWPQDVDNLRPWDLLRFEEVMALRLAGVIRTVVTR